MSGLEAPPAYAFVPSSPTPSSTFSPSPVRLADEDQSLAEAAAEAKQYLTSSHILIWTAYTSVVHLSVCLQHLWYLKYHSFNPLIWLQMTFFLIPPASAYHRTRSSRQDIIRYLGIGSAIVAIDSALVTWLLPTWTAVFALNTIGDNVFILCLGLDLALFAEFRTKAVRVNYGRLDQFFRSDRELRKQISGASSTPTGEAEASGQAVAPEEDKCYCERTYTRNERHELLESITGDWIARSVGSWTLTMIIGFLIWLPWPHFVYFLASIIYVAPTELQNWAEPEAEQGSDNPLDLTTFAWMMLMGVYCFVVMAPSTVCLAQVGRGLYCKHRLRRGTEGEDVEMRDRVATAVV